LNQTQPTTDFLLETIEAKHIAAIEADEAVHASSTRAADESPADAEAAPAPLFESMPAALRTESTPRYPAN
jgi:hypothetical protein